MITQNEENESNEEITTEPLAEGGGDSSSFLVSVSGVRYSAHLFMTIHEIAMPIRAHNAFVRANIVYLGDLVKIPYKELISIPNLGRKALEYVADGLTTLGLQFDMEIGTWPPLDILDLRKQYEKIKKLD